tara:strand:+ start:41 stop:1303 length:1263 start_codon:yes stop_codon:yes gene_type:complete
MSLGNILQALAPIAAGALVPGGATLLGSAALPSIAAGAATGAGIAALSGDDPLMGAVSGGLGGYSGGQLSGAASAGLNPTRATVDYGATSAGNATLAGNQVNTAVGTGSTEGLNALKLNPMGTATGQQSGSYLNRLGGGSTLKGAGKLGAAGLPVIGAAAMPDYSQTEDPMSKYDPKRRLNLGMTTGIQNAMNRDSGLRLNQGFAEGGYLPYRFRDSGNFTPEDQEAFRQYMMQRDMRMREPSRDVVYDEGLQAIENERARMMRDPQSVENERARVLRRIDPNVGIEKENLDRYNALMDSFESEREAIKNMPEGPEKEEIMRMNDNFSRDEFYYNQGGYLETGMGDGMSDDIESSIDGEQPAALSENEFVIPADVVSHLGNGSSDAGAEQLYAMMDRVRKARTGTEKMGKEVNAERLMPA